MLIGFGESGARNIQHTLLDLVERALDLGARRLLVPAAPKLLRKLRHVHRSLRSERHLDAAVGELPEEERQTNAPNRSW